MKNLKKFDIILITTLLVFAAIWFLLQNPFAKTKDPIAKVQVKGQVVKTINLNETLDQVIPITGGDLPVTLEVKKHKIAFKEAVCPDKLCEHYGFIHKNGQTAVCMPAQVSVTIYEE